MDIQSKTKKSYTPLTLNKLFFLYFYIHILFQNKKNTLTCNFRFLYNDINFVYIKIFIFTRQKKVMFF